jgi:hypothetical protein
VGTATPIEAEIKRLRSFVSERAITQNVISPGFNNFSPRARGMILQFGGRIDDTVTRLQYATPALRKASSKEANFSLWTPTPRARNICVGTIVSSPYFVQPTGEVDALLARIRLSNLPAHAGGCFTKN